MISYGGEIGLWGTDEDIFNIIKSRIGWRCSKCGSKINIGNYCWGSGYSKFCINCGLGICDNMVKTLKEMDELVKIQKAECIKNKEEYLTNNMVENL